MNLEQAVRRYQAAYNKLRLATGERVALAWDSTGGLTEDQAADFAPLAASVVDAGQAKQALLTAAFYEAVDDAVTGDATPVRLDPDEFTGLRGVAPTRVYRRPVIQARNAIARGYDFDEAMAQGRSRAQSLAETDIAHTQSVATVAAIAFLPKIIGFVRVLTGTSCPLCVVAQGRFGPLELMPIHAHCDCTSAPIYAAASPGAAVNEQLDRSSDARVAVREHGELGPVLVDADDDFTEVDDF